MKVERLEPRAPRDLARALEGSGGRVAMVAWDYDAGCERLPRVARADWVSAGTQGLFEGILRPREHWAGALPTFDVFAPLFVPYPSGYGFSRSRRDTTRWATAEQLFEVVAAMPPYRSRRDPKQTLDEFPEMIRRWAKQHPEAVTLIPIREELELIRRGAVDRRASYHRIKSAIAGTWRIEVMLPDGDTLRFFARTAETPLGAQYDSTQAFALPDDAVKRAPFAYSLLTKFTRETVPLDSAHAIDAPGITEGYLELVTTPVFQSRDSTVWRGGTNAALLSHRLFAPISSALLLEYLRAQRSGEPDTVVLNRLRARGMTDRWHELYRADSLWMADRFSQRAGARFQGRFVLTRDGRMTGEESLLVNGVRLLFVRMDRLDTRRYPGERLPLALRQ